MPLSSWSIPPDFRMKPDEFHDFVLELFNHVYGLGTDVTGVLDVENIPTVVSIHSQGTDQFIDQGGPNQSSASDIKDAVVKKHNPGGNHIILKQALDPANVGVSAVSVTTADADSTYGDLERDLINELKGDVNQLVTDLNAVATKLNTIMTNMRTSGLIA